MVPISGVLIRIALLARLHFLRVRLRVRARSGLAVGRLAPGRLQLAAGRLYLVHALRLVVLVLALVTVDEEADQAPERVALVLLPNN